MKWELSRSHAQMWELDHKEGWVPKNWCFWTVVLEKTLESPWTARRSNQSILKEINPEYSLEGLMPKLKFQYFGHLMQRVNSLEKTLMLGKIEGTRRRGQQRMRCLDGITDSVDMNLGKLWEMVRNREAWHAAVIKSGHDLVTEQQQWSGSYYCPYFTNELTEALVFTQGFPGGLDGKVSACNAGDPCSVSESGRSPGEGNGNPLQHSWLENPMVGGAW